MRLFNQPYAVQHNAFFLGLAATFLIIAATGIQAQIITENRGQIRDESGNAVPDVLYVAESNGMGMYFTQAGISYVFAESDLGTLDATVGGEKGHLSPLPDQTTYRVDMQIDGSSPMTKVRVEDQVEGVSNYYLPHCADGITGVRSFRRIVYENIYNNIDLVYTCGNQGVVREFVVRPGGNLADVHVSFLGADAAAKTQRGRQLLATPISITTASLATSTSNSGHSSDQPSSLSSAMVTWSTYVGGDKYDNAYALGMANNGEIVAVGATSSTNFPASAGAGQSTNAGIFDAFVIRLNPDGTRRWATYMGGTLTDVANGVAISSGGGGGTVVVGVTSSADFPTSAGAFQPVYSANDDAFMASFNGNGVRQWSTYYGGMGDDEINGVAMSSTSDVVVVGSTTSTDIQLNAGAFQAANAGGRDLFVARFSSAGVRQWDTYYGGSNDEYATDLAIDGAGSILLVGSTESNNFPVSSSAFQATHHGSIEAFVVKLSGTGAQQWATFYGGTGDDEANGVASDGSNNVLFTGSTKSTDFPVDDEPYQGTSAGAEDIFVAKLNSAGVRVWTTYFGGTGDDVAGDIAVNSSGDALITGNTYSTNLPTSFQAYQTSNRGQADAFLLRFSTTGTQQVSSYFGGVANDFGQSIIASGANEAYICGFTKSSDFPVSASAFQKTYGGDPIDAFIARVDLTILTNSVPQHTEPQQVSMIQDLSPNPASTTLHMGFTLPVGDVISVEIFTTDGRRVAMPITAQRFEAGSHQQTLDLTGLSAGSYLMQLRTSKQTSSEQFSVVR